MIFRTVAIAVLLVSSVALAGCTQLTNTNVQTTEDPETRTLTTQTGFEDATHAEVKVFNPTNETWNTSYHVTRNGTTILDENSTVEPDRMWNVAMYEQPGNYTFTVQTGEWSDTTSVQLPRAVGDRKSFVKVKEIDSQFRLVVVVEQ